MIDYLRVVPNSGNSKLGPGWGVTIRPVGLTCDNRCPLMGRGCYAERGRVKIHQTQAASMSGHITKLDGLSRVRWDVAGDNLRPDGSVDTDYLDAKYAWHGRNPDSISLGYTHYPQDLEKAGYGPDSFPDGFNLLASCHSRKVAQGLRKRGWRTARVVDDLDAELDKQERLCPVDVNKHQCKPQTTNCAKCGLCWSKQHQDKSIVFLKF